MLASRFEAANWIGGSILVAWLAYLLVAPTVGFGWIDSWHNEQRAAQIALLTCTAIAYCAIGWLLRSGGASDRWRLPYLSLAFFALGLVSAVRAPFASAALAEVAMFVLLAMLALLTALFVSLDVQRAIRWARWFALFFATAYVLGVATRYLAAVNLGRAVDLDVWILGYANPRFPSALHTILIPLLALTVVEKSEIPLLRAVAAIVLSLTWTINVGLGSRGIWFAYALGIPLTLLIIGWRPMIRVCSVLTLSAVAGVTCYFAISALAPDVTGLAGGTRLPIDNWTSLTSRDVLWKLSWESIASSPWLGIGPMQFAALDSRVGAHPHNWPLQIAAEWGLPALGLLGYAIFKLVQAVKASAEIDIKLATTTLIVVVAIALGLVDGNLIMPVSQIAATLVLGLLIGVLRSARVPSSNPIPGPATVLTSFAVMVAAGLLVAYAVISLRDQPRSTEMFKRSHPGDWFVPRFWEQGNLLKDLSN